MCNPAEDSARTLHAGPTSSRRSQSCRVRVASATSKARVHLHGQIHVDALPPHTQCSLSRGASGSGTTHMNMQRYTFVSPCMHDLCSFQAVVEGLTRHRLLARRCAECNSFFVTYICKKATLSRATLKRVESVKSKVAP